MVGRMGAVIKACEREQVGINEVIVHASGVTETQIIGIKVVVVDNSRAGGDGVR